MILDSSSIQLIQIHAKTKKGFLVKFTLTDAGQVENVLEAIEDMGYEPTANFRNRGAAPRAADVAEPEAPAVLPMIGDDMPNIGPLPIDEPTRQVPPSDNTFMTTSLYSNAIGKAGALWAIRGDAFIVYGVRIYSEVLAVLQDDGINIAALDPSVEYPLLGYLATFSLNSNGNPKKIVKLEKVDV